MNIPGFIAEASLSRKIGQYRGNVAFPASRALKVTPAQGWSPFWRLARCCGPFWPFGGRIECVYQWVPIFYACECTQTFFGPSLFCYPPVIEPLTPSPGG
jgi:hypothetical protein